ncbi:MAG: lysophospholipid acyltransferase family protein [Planctomycetales bacterium]
MKIKNPLFNKTAALLAQGLIRKWMGTLDYQGSVYDPSVDPSSRLCKQRGIYVLWHEYMPSMLNLRGNCDLAMLMSRHRDADILSRLAIHFGFEFVRGSTRRGGQSALRGLMRKSKTHHLAITPDGPRGPRRQLAAGCIYLASKLQLPLVAIGIGYDRPWRLSTWDRFAVPRPYSRCRIVASPHIWLPADLQRDGIEHYRVWVEQTLQQMTAEAEAWAEAGTAKRDQVPLSPTPRDLPTPALDLVGQIFSGRQAPIGNQDPAALRRVA